MNNANSPKFLQSAISYNLQFQQVEDALKREGAQAS